VNLKPFECPPPLLADLLKFDGGTRSRRFLRLIRSYNSLFAFTSFGAAIDKTINNDTAPYVFKINGVVHHRIAHYFHSVGHSQNLPNCTHMTRNMRPRIG
jgi:hypothetical protein